MRKVKFKYYDGKTWIEGRGYFHQWAQNYEQFEAGPGNYTYGLVELYSGKMVEVAPATVIFLDTPQTT